MSKHYIFVDFLARSIKIDVIHTTGKGRVSNQVNFLFVLIRMIFPKMFVLVSLTKYITDFYEIWKPEAGILKKF